MTTTAKKNDVPVDVTWEDQQNICIFSRLHRRVQALNRRLKLLTDDIEKLDDAGTEVMICDEVKYVFGEAFVDVECDQAVDLLDAEKQRIESEKEEVEAELKDLHVALGELKAQLYAKFGSQIYLEEK
ncbi:Prefoldin subunit, putative [Leishmania lindenbergi]|uniref:Prefoldin subunit 4 n=1 Tax=Leishmania lindenbergi TaxID=651832 RepID=A0AAW3AEM8_9TRYP